MLADEVTHVKMGSRWLREVTEGDAERREAALEFQRTVDGLFNFGGRRGEDARCGDHPGATLPRDGGLQHGRDRRDRGDGRRATSRARRSEPQSLRPLRPHLLDVLHRVTQLVDPLGLVTADEPHAPRQRFAAAAGNARIDQRVEDGPLGHAQAAS